MWEFEDFEGLYYDLLECDIVLPNCQIFGATQYYYCPRIEYRWGRDFPHLFRPALEPTQPLVPWVAGSFPGVKSGRGMTLAPYRFYCRGQRKSRDIPLLPLWAVRSLQSLSACAVYLYLYSPCGPYGLYSASVPVQGRVLPFFSISHLKIQGFRRVILLVYNFHTENPQILGAR
jgi:hypothetical protein